MVVFPGISSRALKTLLVLGALTAVALMMLSGTAKAAPGAYKILLAEVYEDQPLTLKAQLVTFPEVVQVTTVDTSIATPSATELAQFDEVVSIGDSNYADHEAWGESLATYVDGGGVVVQSAYDNWDNPEAQPGGRFTSGGYPPFIPGNNDNEIVALGEFVASNPLMQGVTTLTSNEYNTEPELAPGATLVAKWDNGKNAVAEKGRVVSISSFIGDDYGEEAWTGDYGRLLLNAVKTLGPQKPAPPVIVPPTPAPIAPAPTCTVPKLKGKTLKSAKKRIRAATCRVGKLTKKKGATAKTGEIVKQVPKPGSTVPINTKVKVTLAA